MTTREGNLEAPTRHPLDWRDPVVLRPRRTRQGTRARLRHLPRLPALRQPLRRVPDALRPDRREQDRRGGRRGQGRLRQGGRPVLPVRRLLHDQVPVRAAAPVERRLPAPDAARQGGEVPRRRRQVSRQAAHRHRPAGQARDHSSGRAGGQQGEHHAVGAQAARIDAGGCGGRAACRPTPRSRCASMRSRASPGRFATGSARRARWRCSRPATSTTTSPASATTC